MPRRKGQQFPVLPPENREFNRAVGALRIERACVTALPSSNWTMSPHISPRFGEAQASLWRRLWDAIGLSFAGCRAYVEFQRWQRRVFS